MARHYSPKNFLRQAPNALLARYCQEKEILAGVDFAGLSETDIGPIYEAWDHLPSEARRMMESDFRNIDALSSETGVRAVIDEAKEEGEDLEPIFAEMEGFYDKAFCTFSEKQSIFEIALLFVNADNLPARYWRKRKDLPKIPVHRVEKSMREFVDALSALLEIDQTPRELIRHRLWDLGKVNLGPGLFEAFLARGLDWTDAEDTLGNNREVKESTAPLIFAPGKTANGFLPPASVFPLSRMLRIQNDLLVLDREGIARAIAAKPQPDTIIGNVFRNEGQYWTT